MDSRFKENKKGVFFSKHILIIFIGIALVFILLLTLSAKADIIFKEDFEVWEPDSDGDDAPVGWENDIQYKETNSAGGKTYWHNSTQSPFGNCAKVNWNDNHGWRQNEKLYSPVINLSDCENTTLKFWTESYGLDRIADHDYIHIKIIGGGWEYVYDLAEESHNLWGRLVSVNLSKYDGNLIQIRFQKYNWGFRWNWYVSIWSIDNLTIEAECNVDNEPPVTTIDFQGQNHGNYIRSDTVICLTAIDYPIPGASGVKEIWYNYGYGWNCVENNEAMFSIPFECIHTIQWYAIDNQGNIEATNTIEIIIDNLPPLTELYVDSVLYQSGPIYTQTNSSFCFESADLGHCGVGCRNIYYRIIKDAKDNPQWMVYNQGTYFTFTNEGNYTIEYYSDDFLLNEEDVHKLKVLVFHPSYNLKTKSIGLKLKMIKTG
jgi:hypothetical protein